jgi:hypothetical protein
LVTEEAGHTNAATTELLSLPKVQRIREIKSERWVNYPRARQATHILERVFPIPESPKIAIDGSHVC